MLEDILEQGMDPALFPILNSRPELFSDIGWVWEGYSTLSMSRQMGMNGPQPIALGEILAYVGLKRIDDPEEIEEFVSLVQALDSEFMSDFHRKTAKPSKPPPLR